MFVSPLYSYTFLDTVLRRVPAEYSGAFSARPRAPAGARGIEYSVRNPFSVRGYAVGTGFVPRTRSVYVLGAFTWRVWVECSVTN